MGVSTLGYDPSGSRTRLYNCAQAGCQNPFGAPSGLPTAPISPSFVGPRNAVGVQCVFRRAGRGPGQQGQRSSEKSGLRGICDVVLQLSILAHNICSSAAMPGHRRGRRRARSTPELMQLEDLCLLSAFVPTFPTNPITDLPMGTMQSQGLGSVVTTSPKIRTMRIRTCRRPSSLRL